MPEYKPDHINPKNNEFETNYSFNENGYRDTEFENPSYHAILLGDSYVEGYGVDSVYVMDKILETLLNCNNKILNMGLSGNDAFNALQHSKHLFDIGYKSKFLILQINSSDILDLSNRAENYQFNYLVKRSKFFIYAYGSSYIFRHVMHQFAKLELDLYFKQERLKLKAQSYRELVKAVEQLHQLAVENQSKLIVVFQPFMAEIISQRSELFTVIEKLEKNREIISIDMLHFADSNYTDLYWEIDGHFNNEGSKVFSESFSKQMLAIDSTWLDCY